MNPIRDILDRVRNSKDARTKLAAKNIIASVFLKGGSILISFFLVPLTLGYLNEYEYGVWLTISSVLSWVYMFDIGLGNGLRNKLTEAIALGDKTLGKVYVSTTFFFMTLIVAGFYAVFLICQNFLDWYSILNVDPLLTANLGSIISVVFAFFCLSFIFRLVGNVFMAHQLPAVNELLAFLGNAISLIIIYVLTKTTAGSLYDVALTFSSVPAIVYALAIPLTFLRYREISPSVKYIRVGYFNSLVSIGFKFMVIQISCLIIFMTSNLIISRMFGPQDVTPYNIANRLFSLLSVGFTIIITPFWSAVTEAYTKGETGWIAQNVTRLRRIWLLTCLLGALIVALSPLIYELWVGKEVAIPAALSVACCLYALIQNWNNIYSYTINGIGRLTVSLICSIVSAVVYIPLAVLLGNRFGLVGVVAALCLSLSVGSIVQPIQYAKLIKGKATGIWVK